MGFQDNIPIYVQIADDIKNEIISGKLQAMDKLLSVRQYSAKYQVTALTIQRAVALLESEGIIHTQKGVGSFVNSNHQEPYVKKWYTEEVPGFSKPDEKDGVWQRRNPEKSEGGTGT